MEVPGKPVDKTENPGEQTEELSLKSQNTNNVTSPNKDQSTVNNFTGNNSDTDEVLTLDQRKITLSPELQYLRELLKEDMEKLLIKPLQDRMTTIENSHELLESKGVLIDTIREENKQLKYDCNLVK